VHAVPRPGAAARADGTRDAPRTRPRGPRAFPARASVAWRVEAVPGDAVPAARGPACLVFHSDAAIRRVRRYPPNGCQLSDAELEVLS
jgi:hypothetical protein